MIDSPAPSLYLVDANILSFARKHRHTLAELVGCPENVLALPLVAWAECVVPPAGNRVIVADYRRARGAVRIVRSDPALIVQARAWADRYQEHGARFEDMLVAATAVAKERALLSTNWRHLHFVEGLWLIDARCLYQGPPAPDLLSVAPPASRGPVQPPPRCCSNLVRLGLL